MRSHLKAESGWLLPKRNCRVARRDLRPFFKAHRNKSITLQSARLRNEI